MSWLRIDDGFSRHPKVTALTFKERWVWMDILCYCARYETGGYLPANIREHIAGATVMYLSKCSGLELLDVVAGELRVHDWEKYAPKDPTGADRQAAWRNKKRNGDVTADVTESVMDETSTSRAGAARVPVPSRPKDSSNGRPVLRPPALNGLPDEEQVETLMRLIGNHADAGTRHVISANARRMPQAALGKVIESVRTQSPRNRARYVVGALRSERKERAA